MKDVLTHNNWLKQIGEHIGEDRPREIILFSMAYTLQSLRCGEDLKRFNWGMDTP